MRLVTLFSPRGTIDRAPYFFLGLALVLAKLATDAALSLAVFHQPWRPEEYLWLQFSVARWERNPASFLFVLTMLTVAAPFAWIGVCLTTQRLRAMRAPIWLVLILFAPFLKFFLFALLCLLPSQPARESVAPPLPPESVSGFRRWIPDSALGSALLAVAVSASLGCGFVALAVFGLGHYFSGLFVGAPFGLGFIAALLHNARRSRTLGQSIGVALLAMLVIAIALLAIAIEGAVCLLMAAPLAVCLAVAGAVVAHALLGSMRRHQIGVLMSVTALLPLLLLVEKQASLPPPIFAVTSEIVVAAPPDKVWPHVIGFAQIAPPNELIFRAGVAYPVRAVIDGRGVGAIRHCIFSTGEFVEPITVWQEPAHLAFDVAAQPDPLQELSPYRALHTAHLSGYFKSVRGEFRLRALGADRTLLQGTTWYSDRVEPQIYWRLWSDFLIHRIHQRVLDHIRRETETAPQTAASR